MTPSKILVAAALLCASLSALAQAEKPITLISPYPPGGVTDAVARVISPLLSKSMRQPVIVENITGASGSLAANKMFSSPADGNVIMMVSPGETIMPPLLLAGVKFKSEDFRLLVNGPAVPVALLARPNLPMKNVAELIDYASNPANKPLTYGSFGAGSVPHIAGEHFNKLAGVKLSHIPYRGGAPVINDLIGGQIDVSFFPLAGGAIQMVDTGRLKILGVALAKPMPQYAKYEVLSNHPKLKEFVHTSWQSMAIPKNTPPAIVEKLHASLNSIFNSPYLLDFAAKNNSYIPPSMTTAQIEKQYNEEIARTRALANALNLKPQ